MARTKLSAAKIAEGMASLKGWKADGDASGLPGGAPFTRGGRVLGTSVNG